MTEDQQSLFLETYRKTGMMQKSCRAAGVSRKQVEAFSNRETASAEVFKINLEDAIETFNERIETEVVRRAIDGWDEPVFHQGLEVGSKRVYSDALLIKLSEANVKKYSKKVEVDLKQPLAVVIKTFGTTQEDLH